MLTGAKSLQYLGQRKFLWNFSIISIYPNFDIINRWIQWWTSYLPGKNQQFCPKNKSTKLFHINLPDVAKTWRMKAEGAQNSIGRPSRNIITELIWNRERCWNKCRFRITGINIRRRWCCALCIQVSNYVEQFFLLLIFLSTKSSRFFSGKRELTDITSFSCYLFKHYKSQK